MDRVQYRRVLRVLDRQCPRPNVIAFVAGSLLCLGWCIWFSGIVYAKRVLGECIPTLTDWIPGALATFGALLFAAFTWNEQKLRGHGLHYDSARGQQRRVQIFMYLSAAAMFASILLAIWWATTTYFVCESGNWTGIALIVQCLCIAAAAASLRYATSVYDSVIAYLEQDEETATTDTVQNA